MVSLLGSFSAFAMEVTNNREKNIINNTEKENINTKPKEDNDKEIKEIKEDEEKNKEISNYLSNLRHNMEDIKELLEDIDDEDLKTKANYLISNIPDNIKTKEELLKYIDEKDLIKNIQNFEKVTTEKWRQLDKNNEAAKKLGELIRKLGTLRKHLSNFKKLEEENKYENINTKPKEDNDKEINKIIEDDNKIRSSLRFTVKPFNKYSQIKGDDPSIFYSTKLYSRLSNLDEYYKLKDKILLSWLKYSSDFEIKNIFIDVKNSEDIINKHTSTKRAKEIIKNPKNVPLYEKVDLFLYLLIIRKELYSKQLCYLHLDDESAGFNRDFGEKLIEYSNEKFKFLDELLDGMERLLFNTPFEVKTIDEIVNNPEEIDKNIDSIIENIKKMIDEEDNRTFTECVDGKTTLKYHENEIRNNLCFIYKYRYTSLPIQKSVLRKDAPYITKGSEYCSLHSHDLSQFFREREVKFEKKLSEIINEPLKQPQKITKKKNKIKKNKIKK